VPPVGGRKHDFTDATSDECAFYSGALIGREICTCGIVGRSIHAETTCGTTQKIQSSLANIKDKSLLQRMTKKPKDDRNALTCYIRMLEAEIGQLENGRIPVPAIKRTSLANSKAALASDVSKLRLTKPKTGSTASRPGECALVLPPLYP
jgi:hypothetical protein